MEIIGRNIPQLQSAISSGLDNVSAGIAQSVKSSGISALDDTFQIFSTSNMGIAADANLLPAVANVAEYTDPITALGRQSTSSSEAATSALPLLQTMQDPKFRPEAELTTFTEANVNEAFKKLGELLYKAESESAQGRSILKNDSLLTPAAYIQKVLDDHQKEIEDKMNEMSKQKEIEQVKKFKESVGQVDQLPYISATDGDLGVTPQGLANGAGSASPQIEADSFAVAGTGTASANTLEARGIIIVGGKTDGSASASSNTVEERGIIIVGGKTDGTYFQTIDDSINDLRNDPQPETLKLLQNQVTAVQDMTSTTMETVQLNRQYLGSLIGTIRG